MSNSEFKKYDDEKRMWTTNYRNGENPNIHVKWIDNKYLESTKPADANKPVDDANKPAADAAKPVANTQTTLQIATIFVFAWAALGLAAFIWSLVCFKKSGTIEQKVLGLLLAIFIGPLFFIYYKYSPTYCK
jgi:hypothetical protein